MIDACEGVVCPRAAGGDVVGTSIRRRHGRDVFCGHRPPNAPFWRGNRLSSGLSWRRRRSARNRSTRHRDLGNRRALLARTHGRVASMQRDYQADGRDIGHQARKCGLAAVRPRPKPEPDTGHPRRDTIGPSKEAEPAATSIHCLPYGFRPLLRDHSRDGRHDRVTLSWGQAGHASGHLTELHPVHGLRPDFWRARSMRWPKPSPRAYCVRSGLAGAAWQAKGQAAVEGRICHRSSGGGDDSSSSLTPLASARTATSWLMSSAVVGSTPRLRRSAWMRPSTSLHTASCDADVITVPLGRIQGRTLTKETP